MAETSFYFALCVTAVLFAGSWAQFDQGQVIAMVVDKDVDETSGMAASRLHNDVLYVVNDGGEANVKALSATTGQVLATLTLDGADNKDWEDMAVGPGPNGGSYIYVCDTMNRFRRDYITLYRFPEPSVLSSATIKPEVLRVDWSHFSHSEALMVDDKGIVYVLKTVTLSRKPVIYQVPDIPWNGGKVDLINGKEMLVLSKRHNAPRGGDISRKGDEILMTDHAKNFYWKRLPGESVIDAVTARVPVEISVVDEVQRDAICWRADGSGYYTLSEGTNQPLLFYSRTSTVTIGTQTSLPRLAFPAIGDWGAPGEGQRAVAAEMGKWSQDHNAQFVIALGDNFYENGIVGETDTQIETTWRRVYTHTSLMKTWYVIAGNHDHRFNRAYNQVRLSRVDSRWYMPSLYYSFYKVVGRKTVHFIMIDTQTGQRGTDNTQLDWFTKELENSRGDWIIVCGHHPVFSTGDHGRFISTRGMYQNIRPLMERHKVALYIAGHDHDMEHLQPQTNKIVDYVISGAGSKMRKQNTNAMEDTKSKGVTSTMFASEYAFVGVEIDENEVKVSYINKDGGVFYEFKKTNPRSSGN